MAACTALVCGAQCSMGVRLGYGQNQTSNVVSGMIGQLAARHCLHRSNELLAQLSTEDLDLMKERRLRWHVHVERSNGTVKSAYDILVDGKREPGRPKADRGITESESSRLLPS